jgi:N-acetyl-anhydromuramyl-L-alanine amidase AmpD
MKFQDLTQIKRIIVHGSFSKISGNLSYELLKRIHQEEKGFNAPMGYHCYIQKDGTKHYGRNLDVVGAHAAPWNTNSIGVCLEGGMREDFNGNWQDQSNWVNNYTDESIASCYEFVKEVIVTLYEAGNDVTNLDIIGHCDVPGVSKKCPGFNVEDVFGWITK